MKSKKYKNKRGFTVLEILLYSGIAAIVVTSISAFFFALLQTRVKNQVIAEVDQQGTQVMQLITQAIRNAEGINSPSQGATTSSISIDVQSAPDDPTIFDLSGDIIQITEGAGSVVDLTNGRVSASALSFQNLSRTGTKDIIQIEFTIDYKNPEGRKEFDYGRTFLGTAMRR